LVVSGNVAGRGGTADGDADLYADLDADDAADGPAPARRNQYAAPFPDRDAAANGYADAAPNRHAFPDRDGAANGDAYGRGVGLDVYANANAAPA
jgi:hypothetical protein